MKGIIIAGGRNTRLYPVTKVINKALLPVYKYPLLYYPLNTLLETHIDDIIIVTNPDDIKDFDQIIQEFQAKSGKEFEYRIIPQEKPLGIAHALGLCYSLVGKHEKIAVILGDNFIEDDISDQVTAFSRNAMVFLKEVEHPESLGVATIEKNKIVDIIEKPDNPKSNLGVIGLYLYDEKVWDIIKAIEPSKRGEWEITDVNKTYLTAGKLRYRILKGEWRDCGTPDDLLKIANFVKKTQGP